MEPLQRSEICRLCSAPGRARRPAPGSPAVAAGEPAPCAGNPRAWRRPRWSSSRCASSPRTETCTMRAGAGRGSRRPRSPWPACTRGSWTSRRMSSESSARSRSLTRSVRRLILTALQDLRVPAGEIASGSLSTMPRISSINFSISLSPPATTSAIDDLRPLVQVVEIGFGDGDPVALVHPLDQRLHDPPLVLEAAARGEVQLEDGNSDDHRLERRRADVHGRRRPEWPPRTVRGPAPPLRWCRPR